jgi:hypothetical protein
MEARLDAGLAGVAEICAGAKAVGRSHVIQEDR